MIDVSIVIICGKDRGYLKDAIRSAENQDFDNYEIIVQHDESKSMAENTNAGVRKAQGKYIKWLHDDDLLLPNCLRDLWEGRGEADVLVSGIEYIGEWDGDQFYFPLLPADFADFVEHNPINQAGTMYKRQVLLDNPLDESLWTAEEYELNLRLWQKGYVFKYVHAVVAQYRVHDQMKSGSAWGFVEKSNAPRRAEIERIRNMFRT